MATEVSLRDITTGEPVFYSKYEEARDNANDYEVISIYANLDEQIVLKNLVDVYIDPGTVVDFSGKVLQSLITENNANAISKLSKPIQPEYKFGIWDFGIGICFIEDL